MADPLIQRTFSAFLQVSHGEPIGLDRGLGDLVLNFCAATTTELQKGEPPSVDCSELMIGRGTTGSGHALTLVVVKHLALFIHLIKLILTDEYWVKDQSDLISRVSTVEGN